MAGRGAQTFKKRQKEQQRKEKQEEKRAKRLQRKEAGGDSSNELDLDAVGPFPPSSDDEEDHLND